MPETITLSLACNADQAVLLMTLHRIFASSDSREAVKDCLDNSAVVKETVSFLVTELIGWINTAADCNLHGDDMKSLIAWINQATAPKTAGQTTPRIPTGWITTKKAMQISGYNIEHVRRLIREGRLEATKVSRCWWINPYTLPTKQERGHRWWPKTTL